MIKKKKLFEEITDNLRLNKIPKVICICIQIGLMEKILIRDV